MKKQNLIILGFIFCSCFNNDKETILRQKIDKYFLAWNNQAFSHPDFSNFKKDTSYTWHDKKEGKGIQSIFNPNSGWKQWDKAWNGYYTYNIIKIDIGRYGPYIRCGKTSRSVNAPDSILDLNLERAVEILSTERKQANQRVIKELGIDPETKAAIEIKDGRYGTYVTNGKINATLPKTISTDGITLEIAIQLIADKKAKGHIRKKGFQRKS